MAVGGEVCGSNMVSYASQRHFDVARCKVKGNATELYKFKDGPCGKYNSSVNEVKFCTD